MKNLFLILLAVPLLAIGQSSDATLTTQNNTLIYAKPYAPNRAGAMFQGLIDSKVSLLGSYSNPSWITGLAASKLSGTTAIANGGTNLSALGSALQQLRVNASGTALEYFTPSFTSGSSVLYGNGSGGFSNSTIGDALTFSSGVLKVGGSISDNVSITGSYNFSLPKWSFVNDGTLYPSVGNTYDIGTATTVAELTGANGIWVSGNYAYVATFTGDALQILDISDPTNVIVLGKLTNGTGGALLNGPIGVHVVGNYAFVTSNVSNALEVVDVSNPLNPTHAGSIVDGAGGAALTSPWNMDIVGNYAYVVSSSNAIEIIDISTPTNPTHVGKLTTGLSTPTGIEVSGNYAYVCNFGNNTFVIANISNPASPSVTATVTHGVGGALLSQCHGVWVSGNYAYVTARASNALNIINISTPDSPSVVGTLTDGTGSAELTAPENLQVIGNYAYIACYTGGDALEIVDISTPSAPTHVGKILNGSGGAALSGANRVYVSGNYAYVASFGSNALEVVNISTVSSPIHADKVLDNDTGTGNAVRRGYFGTELLAPTGTFSTAITSPKITVTDPATSNANTLAISSSYTTTGRPLSVTSTGYFHGYFQGTTANNQVALQFENNRGSLASYGSLVVGGSTSNLGNIFGLTRPDRVFLFADGASNTGLALGTLTSDPIDFATNNTVRLNIGSSGSITVSDAVDFVFNTTTGTKHGTSTSQKQSFWNATPIVQPSGNVKTALSNLGLVASPTIASDIVGTATNDNATAGNIGEHSSSLIASGSAVGLTTAIAANVTSISLTAGDWDVEGNINFVLGSATVTQKSGGVTSTSATVPTDGSEVFNGTQFTLTSVTDGLAIPRKRISISGTTTVYLVASATFSAGTVTAFGAITARRVR